MPTTRLTTTTPHDGPSARQPASWSIQASLPPCLLPPHLTSPASKAAWSPMSAPVCRLLRDQRARTTSPAFTTTPAAPADEEEEADMTGGLMRRAAWARPRGWVQ